MSMKTGIFFQKKKMLLDTALFLFWRTSKHAFTDCVGMTFSRAVFLHRVSNLDGFCWVDFLCDTRQMSECRLLHVDVTIFYSKTFMPRGTVSPATHWDLFLTVLLLWCRCQHEWPSPLDIQRVYCPVCLLPDTRCCHGYLWIQGDVLGKQVLFQRTYRPHTPLLCW